MAHIRTWADIEARGGDDWLTPAEQQLIAACKAGVYCTLGDGSLPPEGKPAPDVELRAEVLRYLILGGCKTCRVDAIGVVAVGGHVTGTLNLDFCSAKGALQLFNCRFDHRLDTEQTRFALVNLSGSHLNGWWAQGMVSKGAVFLRDITTTATVALNRASIGGPVACEKARFELTEGFALNAQGAKVAGSVFLRDITASATFDLNSATIGGQLACVKAQFKANDEFALKAQGAKVTADVFLSEITATATVALNGATIGGQLVCDKAQFKATVGFAFNAQGTKVAGSVFLSEINASATVDLNSATIGGQLSCIKSKFAATHGHALTLQSADVTKELIWRDVKHLTGSMSFNSTHVHVLADDATSWSNNLPLDFDGMTYDRIAGDTDAASRLAWLAKGSNWGGTFYPQPYTQLAKVLRDMGHVGDARIVLMERERLLYRARRKTRWELHNGDPKDGVPINNINYHTIFWSFLLRWLIGYGYKPFRSVITLGALILFTAIIADRAWQTGDFAPNAAPVIVSEGWRALHATESNPAQVWAGDRAPEGWAPPAGSDGTWTTVAPGRDWESFNALAYGADVAIPIIDIGQTAAWAPSTTRGPWGWHLWWLKGVISVAGWIVTALGAAAITGIIRRD